MTPHTPKVLLFAGALLTALLLTAAAVAGGASITADGVDPDPLVIDVGDIAAFTNDTDDVVRLIDDNDRWDSGDLQPGERFTIRFDVGGTFSYTSEDGSITGTIEVGAAGQVDGTEDDVEPTEAPTALPTTEPTAEPTAEPTTEPTAEPTTEPTAEPTTEPMTTPAETAADQLAATGLPSAAIAWSAALLTLLGILLVKRTGRG
ncbi:hypothetical protein BH23ACT9_BH23ACT9_19610 [soil metagenome]